MFSETLGTEDTRRERMEVGLGIWSDSARRYYPLEVLRDQGRAIVDQFDGRPLVIYLDPLSATPAAVFVETSSARIEGRDVLLDNGRRVNAGQLIDGDGLTTALERPKQIFTRWYGFSLTFPGPEIYGE
jgi:hypothetical protein